MPPWIGAVLRAFAKLAGCFQRERPVSITCDRTSPKRGPQPQNVVSGAS